VITKNDFFDFYGLMSVYPEERVLLQPLAEKIRKSHLVQLDKMNRCRGIPTEYNPFYNKYPFASKRRAIRGERPRWGGCDKYSKLFQDVLKKWGVMDAYLKWAREKSRKYPKLERREAVEYLLENDFVKKSGLWEKRFAVLGDLAQLDYFGGWGDAWQKVGHAAQDLYDAKSLGDRVVAIDRVHAIAHHEGNLVADHFQEKSWIGQALDLKRSAKTPKEYADKMTGIVRSRVLEHHRL